LLRRLAQEATAAQDSAGTLVKDVEDRAVLVEREAWERMSSVEVESAVVLGSAREDAESIGWKIALLEGELLEACWAREVAEGNSRGFSNAVASAEQWREEFEREY
jgi:hypothetical protein